MEKRRSNYAGGVIGRQEGNGGKGGRERGEKMEGVRERWKMKGVEKRV